MYIELKEIDKDTLKVGDVVGIAREVSYGWKSSFRHQLITPAKITRITPKRTKIETDQFGEHDKNEIFYEYDENAEKENELAIMFKQFRDAKYGYSPCRETKMKIIKALRDLDDRRVELSENLYDGMD